MRGHCGLANPNNPCRCHKRVETAMAAELFSPGKLLFADHPARKPSPNEVVLDGKRAVEDLHQAVTTIQRGNPDYKCSDRFIEELRATLSSEDYRVLWS